MRMLDRRIDPEKREAVVLDALTEAWNTFVLLKSTHPDDLTDFRRAIHECQRILATRQMRRIDPEIWISRTSDDNRRGSNEKDHDNM